MAKMEEDELSCSYICGLLGGTFLFGTSYMNVALYTSCKDQVNWNIMTPCFITFYCVNIVLLAISFYLNYSSDKKRKIEERALLLILMKKMCHFNSYAKEEQFKLVDNIFKLTVQDNWENLETTRVKWMNAVKSIRKMSLDEKKKYMHLLFKLAIARDGIKVNEWSFLMKIMEDANLPNNWKLFFVKRYSALRTEFEEQKEESKPKSKPLTVNYKYFNILGIKPTTDITQIKKAYHAMALQFHPDMHQNAKKKEKCEEKMAMINDAYEKVMAGL